MEKRDKEVALKIFEMGRLLLEVSMFYRRAENLAVRYSRVRSA